MYDQVEEYNGLHVLLEEPEPTLRVVSFAASEAAVVIARADELPAFADLTSNVGFAGLALRIERIEILLEAFLGRLPGVDRAALGARLRRDHRRLERAPWQLEAALRDFVSYYNNECHHESLDNVTPADVYFGRQYEVLSKRAKIKRLTMQKRKQE